MSWSLFDAHGRRKYLVPLERKTFLQTALDVGGKTASFCTVLVFCGARISEVLSLSPERIDDGSCTIIFRTLKRRKLVYRGVPVPRKVLQYLDAVHHYREAQCDPAQASKPLWKWSRTTAWRRVKFVMQRAAQPPHVSKPKALRHAFGAEAVMNGVSLTMVQRWLGHANMRTTVIYTTLVGDEERALARKTWKHIEALL
jgi:integrase/recombinase XerD